MFYERVLDYGCLVSMNQLRLVQDFSPKFLVTISLRRILFVKTFMLNFTDIWKLTSSCPFLTPTVRVRFGELGKIGKSDRVYIQNSVEEYR